MNGAVGIRNAFVVTMNDTSSVHQNRLAGIGDRKDGSRPMNLTLNGRSTIRDNGQSGVAFAAKTSAVKLNGRSTIHDNGDGGIRGGRVTLNDRSMIHDHEDDGIGNAFVVTMNDESSIRRNVAGISDWEGRSRPMDLTLNDHSSIRRNGWGVFFGVRNGTVTMNGASSIARNGDSGGLHVASDTTLIGVVCGPRAGANVRNNTPRDCVIR